jgi:hypothetical protein
MNMYESPPFSEHARDSASVDPPMRPVPRLAARIFDWFHTCAEYYAAATTYEQLSRLSDADLRRRGLDRSTLARDLCGLIDRSARR